MNSVLLAFLMAWSAAFASTNLVAPSAECACDAAVGDRLENPLKFSFGVFDGECVDSCRYRKSSTLESNVFSNFLHLERYWKARVPVERAERAAVGFEEFLPGIYHVFLVFQFPDSHPVILSPQDGKGKNEKVSTLVISPEGIPPKEGKYNFIDAYLGRYVTGVRLISRDELARWSVHKLKHKVSLYSLKISPAKAVELLKAGLQFGQQHSFQQVYALLSNNCATNTLDLVDKVLKPEASEFPIYYGWLYPFERSLPIAGPFGTLKVFLSRGLIQPQPEILL
jgi:hypothetical protein